MAVEGSVVPEDRELRALLGEAQTIAVVGLSSKPNRPSLGVAGYLQDHGYRIVPVNPRETEVLGERAYPTLRDIPSDVRVDVVDEASARRLEAAGIGVAMNRCILVDHERLRIPPKSRNAARESSVPSMSRNGTF